MYASEPLRRIGVSLRLKIDWRMTGIDLDMNYLRKLFVCRWEREQEEGGYNPNPPDSVAERESIEEMGVERERCDDVARRG